MCACGGQCARCGVAGRQTRRQGCDVSVGEAGFWLVGTCSLPQGMSAELGGEGSIGQPKPGSSGALERRKLPNQFLSCSRSRVWSLVVASK